MSDESARVKELESYQIMDTEPEQEFDSLVQLIAEVCEVPVAYISFIDNERQWYKSKIGLEADEAPKETVFCNTTLQQDKIIHVPDLTKDSRFKDSPFVTEEPHLRFYAGSPLKSPNGFNVGTVCLVDTKTKELNDFQIRTLNTIAHQIVTQLELKKKIRELKQHQDSIIQTEKLASLGRMAGGIAHELNNPLQVLNNYLELVMSRARKVGHKDDFADIVKNSKNTVFRMARIIQTMLGFVKSRRNTVTEEITLLSLIDDTQMLLSERLTNFTGKFQVHWHIDNQLQVTCNPVEVSQVLINLISNAIDAAKASNDPKVELNIEQKGEGLIFTVTDNGDGIPDDVIQKIREPFFTTKELGQGTGLGLFICHQVAERMGGQLEYDRQGELTHFHLKIPFSAPQ